MTSIRSPLWLTATVGQSSNPLNSENASPFGTCTVYLSCAEMALPPKTASATAIAAPAAAEVARTLRGDGNDGVLNMIILLGWYVSEKMIYVSRQRNRPSGCAH